MKKIVGTILLICFLSTTTEAHEAFKLPRMIIHFFEHGLSVDEFLILHYASNHTQQEHEHPGDMPFQGNHSCHMNVLSFFLNENLTCNLTPGPPRMASVIHRTESLPSQYQCHIWQPPKIG